MEENKTSTWEEYRKRTHVIGRVVSAVTLVMLVGAPFLMGKILGAYPDLGAVVITLRMLAPIFSNTKEESPSCTNLCNRALVFKWEVLGTRVLLL